MSSPRNCVIFSGRATRDAELKQAGKSQVCTIRLANNERIKQRDGEWKEKTTFVDVECWGKRAEFAGEYVKKGNMVHVMGKLEQDEWGEGDSRRTKHKIYASYDLQVDRPRDSNQDSSSGGDSSGSSTGSASGGEDLPF